MVEPTLPPASGGKPEIEHFTSSLNASSRQSRIMLIGIILTSIAASIALLNSMHTDWNWHQSKVSVCKTAMERFIFPDEIQAYQAESVHRDSCCWCPLREAGVAGKQPFNNTYSSVEAFAYDLEECYKDVEKITRDTINAIINETFQSDSLKLYFPYWIRIKPIMLDANRLPTRKERIKLYSSLVKAAIFVQLANIETRKTLESSYNKLQSHSESFSLVHIPVLGVAFDINNLGQISGVVFLAILILLYLSMVRESRNLKILFIIGERDDNIDNWRLFQLLSINQILTVPLKLYSPNKTNDKLTRELIYGIFWLPVAVLATIFLYDLRTSLVGFSLNPLLTYLTTYATFYMLLCVIFVAYKISDRQRTIDRQWENQYYLLNLEKLFNLQPDDLDTGVWTTPDQVRINWANTVEAAKRLKMKSGRTGESASVKLLERFIDRCYDDKPDKLESSNNDQVEHYWTYFKTWFDANKQKSTRREFRESLVDLMNGPFEKPAK